MSGHLIGCAGTLTKIPGPEERDLPTSHKLALLAFADSADDRTHIGFPGYEGVQAWAVCSRGRAAELIRDLVTWGLLQPHKRGHRGQRAEYIVFPGGCCDLHRAPVPDEPGPDVNELARAAGISVDQARLLLAAMAPVVPVVPVAAPPADPQEKGSGASDAMSGTVSSTSDPIPPSYPETRSTPVDNPGKGPESVQRSRSNTNAFTPSKENPPTPASGGAGCARHRTTTTNCRGCGTTNRQIAAKAKADQAAAHRAAEQAAIAAERAKPRGRKPGTEGAKAAVRAGIAAARQKTTTTAGASR